jgi:hypothetical protein
MTSPVLLPESGEIGFDEGVRLGKDIVKAMDDAGPWALGELASRLEPRYRDRTLKKFAKAIGKAECTVARYKQVYEAFAEIPAPGRKFVKYAAARELVHHPDRIALVLATPNMTKGQAHAQMLAHQATGASTTNAGVNQQAGDGSARNTHQWLADLAKLAQEMTREAGFADQPVTPQVRAQVAQGVELLPTLRQAGQEWARLVNYLEQIMSQAQQDAEQQDAEQQDAEQQDAEQQDAEQHQEAA